MFFSEHNVVYGMADPERE